MAAWLYHRDKFVPLTDEQTARLGLLTAPSNQWFTLQSLQPEAVVEFMKSLSQDDLVTIATGEEQTNG